MSCWKIEKPGGPDEVYEAHETEEVYETYGPGEVYELDQLKKVYKIVWY